MTSQQQIQVSLMGSQKKNLLQRTGCTALVMQNAAEGRL